MDNILCFIYPLECATGFLIIFAFIGIYLLFQHIAQKINDKFPQFSISTIMIIEAVVLAVISVGIFIILPNVINSGGGGSNHARARSRR